MKGNKAEGKQSVPSTAQRREIKKIGVLTSGGDAPGMNACIYAAVKAAARYGVSVVGIRDGYSGLVRKSSESTEAMKLQGKLVRFEPGSFTDPRERGLDMSQDREWFDLYEETFIPLRERDLNSLIRQGGTTLGTARCPEFYEPEGRALAHRTLVENEIDALIVIGGDGSFQGAMRLMNEHDGYPINCVPATIDNDIACTDYTIGFNSAVRTVCDAIENIRDTMRSHKRTGFVVAMGRFCGDIAELAGRSSGADIVMLPPPRNKVRFNEWEHQLKYLMDQWEQVRQRGLDPTIVVLAEGCITSDDEFFKPTKRLPDGSWDPTSYERHFVELGRERPLMTATELRFMLQNRLNQKYPGKYSLRVAVPAYIQRGGRPTLQDRLLADSLTSYAVDLLMQGYYGYVAATKKDKQTKVLLTEALQAQMETTKKPLA